jgi:CheY-like chemotaxis protein
MITSTAVSTQDRVAPLEIAFADDVPEIQKLAREWLTLAGHRVTCVDNGLELAKVCATRHFDLVITDVMMPERDGFEVVTTLKSTHPNIRIIVISGGGRIMAINDSLRVAQRLGADAVLAKPFSGAQLMAAVAKVAASLSPCAD